MSEMGDLRMSLGSLRETIMCAKEIMVESRKYYESLQALLREQIKEQKVTNECLNELLIAVKDIKK